MRNAKSKALLLVMALSLITAFLPRTVTAAGFRVVVNGTTVDGAQPEMVSGQLAVAIRPVLEAIGADVTWNDNDEQITMEYDDSTLAMWIGSRTAYQDGERLTAPLTPYYRNGRSMGPAWWLAARFNTKVSFDGATLYITTPAPSVAGPQAPLMDPDYYFPFANGSRYETYYDSWGDPRSYQGRNFGHEGTDILAGKGTPIISIASGTIIRYGWNTLGGYRLTIQLDDHPEYKFYYAHMDRYAPGLAQGVHVKAGQIIGYVGNTGEGPERTEGKFVTHLHFGIYDANFKAIDAYQFLKFWERHKVSF